MPAIATETKSLGINDLKLYPLTTDTAAALTYGTGVDVPAITSLDLGFKINVKELRGDEKLLDTYSKLESIDWSFSNKKISLAAFAILVGGTVAAGGVTPSQTQTLTLTGASTGGYFKMEGKTDYSDVGDEHTIFYKCKCEKFDIKKKGEDYVECSASGRAIPTVKDDKIFDIVLNETAAPLTT